MHVKAAGVGSTDLLMLAGNYPYAQKMPFVPGYEVAGVVDAIETGVDGFTIGDRVAALTLYGGYGEFLVRAAEHFLPIQTALVTGAGGGVGTAALQLLRLAGVKTYGAASVKKHGFLLALGSLLVLAWKTAG